ncbi:hypothetical protein B0H13DRAFT_1855495 [Mycena leptocephala]|nr:hypothetical protein B0H13DRAFT_1855495 [Mycena leptocephala]
MKTSIAPSTASSVMANLHSVSLVFGTNVAPSVRDVIKYIWHHAQPEMLKTSYSACQLRDTETAKIADAQPAQRSEIGDAVTQAVAFTEQKTLLDDNTKMFDPRITVHGTLQDAFRIFTDKAVSGDTAPDTWMEPEPDEEMVVTYILMDQPQTMGTTTHGSVVFVTFKDATAIKNKLV